MATKRRSEFLRKKITGVPDFVNWNSSFLTFQTLEFQKKIRPESPELKMEKESHFQWGSQKLEPKIEIPNQGGQGQVLPTVRAALPGGILARLQGYSTPNCNATVERELDWQAKIEGDTNRAPAFCNQVLGQQTFRVFAFMKPKSLIGHMVHSMGTFFGISGLATDVQNKQIAFIGNPAPGCFLVLFILLPTNLWTWTKANILWDTTRFKAYYDDEKNQRKLWVTGAWGLELTEVPLPRLLALPMFLAKY